MCPLLSAFHLDLSRTLLLRTLSNSAQCTEEKKKKKAVLFQPNRGRQIAESLQQLPVCDARNILEMIHYRPVFFSWIHPDFRGQPGRLLSHSQSGQFPSQAARLWPASGARRRFLPRFYFQLAVFTNENRTFALGGK